MAPRRNSKHKMGGKTKGIVRPDPFRFEWKIERFFEDCEKVGDFYKSPTFVIPIVDKITNWYLEVYPKGVEEYQDRTSLYLYFECKEKINVTVDFCFSLLNEQGAVVVKEEKTFFTFNGPSDNFGWGDYIEQDFIKNVENNVLNNDTLIIAFEIRFQPIQEVIQNFSGYDEWLTKIGEGNEDYEKLLESNKYTDVTFIVQDQKINGHKAILSLKSPTLTSIFHNDMEQRTVIHLPDDYDIIKELFRFIYSKKVRNIEQIASKLLIAADKYRVNELKALCEKTLYDSLTVNNAVEYLKLTEVCNTIHLKRLIIQFIGTHLKDLIKEPEFVDLKSSVMFEILQAIAMKT